MKECKFTSGQEVRLKSQRDQLGVIMGDPKIIAGEGWYRVNFGGGNIITHPESDIELYEAGTSIEDLLINGVFGNRETLSKLITFTKLRFPLRKNIYSFKASRTEFHEFQFKPVLKFIDSQDQRLLIADEVGLGKTIEAGYILQEQKARYDMDRILIVCPSALVQKWKGEMETKFQEAFQIMKVGDIRDFLRKLDKHGDTKLRGICSLQALRGQAILEEWEAASPPLDMVVIDEGHHMRNSATRSHRLGLALSDMADAVLMLTATPVHLGNEDLFYLLRVLNSDEFENFEIFKRRLRANKAVLRTLSLLRTSPLNLEEVKESLETMARDGDGQWFQKNPIYFDVINRVDKIDGTNREQIVELQRDVNRLNLLGHILTRTRKRDVHIKAKRDARIISPEFTEAEMTFYNAVTNFVIAKYSDKGLGAFGSFIAVMPQRQVASCIPAMVDYYTRRIMEDELGGLDSELSDIIIEDVDEDFFDTKRSVSPEYLELVKITKDSSLRGVDSKFDALLETLKEIDEAEPGRQIIIFSYFKKTLEYLSRKLGSAGYQNTVISGDYPAEERNKRIDKFRNDKSVRIMLSSEVGSEGLDFQFCHIMVNYDLPWNPMVVEQRIGRLDRIGQKSERILVFNFTVPGTIEDRIMRRLYQRIHIFEESIGDLEAILGEEIKLLTRDLLTSKLTAEEQEKRISETADVIIRKKQELELLEVQSAKFIGHDEFFTDEIERIQKHKRFISPEELQIFLKEFLEKHHPKCVLRGDGKSPVFTLPINDQLIRFVRSYMPQDDIGFRQFIRKTAGKSLQVTFVAEEAFDNPDLEFVNIGHPITRAITAYYQNHRDELHPVARISLNSSQFPESDFLYFIYLLEVNAARSHRSLETIFVSLDSDIPINEDLGEDLMNEITTKGETLSTFPRISVEEGYKTKQIADDEFGKRITQKRQEIESINDALISARLTSLEQSFTTKYQKKQELLDRARHKRSAPQYIRMVEGGMRNLKVAYEMKRNELEDARKIYINFNPVGAGYLRISHDE